MAQLARWTGVLIAVVLSAGAAHSQAYPAVSFDVTYYMHVLGAEENCGEITLPLEFSPPWANWVASPVVSAKFTIVNGSDATVWASVQHVMWWSAGPSAAHGWMTWYGDGAIEVAAGDAYEAALFDLDLPQVPHDHRFDLREGSVQGGFFYADLATSPESLGEGWQSEERGYTVQIRDYGPTPEPSTWALLACSGLAGWVMWRRRRT